MEILVSIPKAGNKLCMSQFFKPLQPIQLSYLEELQEQAMCGFAETATISVFIIVPAQAWVLF